MSEEAKTHVHVIKRNGEEVTFDLSKIENAIKAANNEVDKLHQLNEYQVHAIADNLEKQIESMSHAVHVEDIQDMVETGIMEMRGYEVAQKYVRYRYKRELARKSNTTDNGILALIDHMNEEVNQENSNKNPVINFDNAIIAAGSRPIQLPFIPHEDPRIWDSTDALELKEVPERLLVMGGGIIGLEMGTVYHALGSQIDVVEMFDQVIPAADKDIVKVFTKRISKKFNLMLETKVTAVEAKEDGIYVTMEGKKAPAEPQRYDAVLVAIGRVPNGKNLDAGKAGVEVDDRGFIRVDKQLRTNVPHIFAIGDIVGQPMLAHKGVHEGHVAAEVIGGKKHYFDPKVIPSIAYTEPEVAWVGLTEKEAKEKGISYETATFPWAASGRAIASDCADGMTKLIFDKESHRVIGGAIVGTNGGELLGEIGLAIEMGCDAEDIALTIHAHPTLHESVGLAAEVFEGSITDLPNPKAKKK